MVEHFRDICKDWRNDLLTQGVEGREGLCDWLGGFWG